MGWDGDGGYSQPVYSRGGATGKGGVQAVFGGHLPSSWGSRAGPSQPRHLSRFEDERLEDREVRQSSRGSQNEWHNSASSVGTLSQNNHVFTRSAGPSQTKFSDSGEMIKLAAMCLVYDATLRYGGVHAYTFQVLDGELGPADGCGFTFDTLLRRRSMREMRAVFVNKKGYICLRSGADVSRLPIRLPQLKANMELLVKVDLDRLIARFEVRSPANVSLGAGQADLSQFAEHGKPLSGFFIAVVTSDVTVSLH
eukprot:gb/GFBE01047394.1/.p1 GENE.gb/GFBE01047394.1/~~gb/GFBE01047394.1/.p1  ORF type:complete len:253 (+),score=29.25 gb/GFBE01047394.1/:1-759(+)